MSFPAQPDYVADEDLEDVPAKTETETDTDMEAGSLLDDDEEYSTLSSPSKYFALLTFFVVIPVGAYVYYYKGGKEKVKSWRQNSGYSRVGGKV